jgi:hypothetical protein
MIMWAAFMAVVATSDGKDDWLKEIFGVVSVVILAYGLNGKEMIVSVYYIMEFYYEILMFDVSRVATVYAVRLITVYLTIHAQEVRLVGTT